MVTGIDAAGLALGIAPLIITALEHHKDFIEPYHALFRYTKRIQDALQAFAYVGIALSDTLKGIAKDAGLTETQYAAVFRIPGEDETLQDADSAAQGILIEHFGIERYNDGFNHLIQMIFKTLRGIANDLGVDIVSEAVALDTLWDSISAARTILNVPLSKRLQQRREYVVRAKLFFKSGTLESRQQRLRSDISELQNFRHNTHELGTKVTRRLKFNRDLKEIQKNAQSLCTALRALSSCEMHATHCIGLQLERRFEKRLEKAKAPVPMCDDQLCFNLALSRHDRAQEWHSLEIIMEVPDQHPAQHQRRAHFSQSPAPVPWREIDQSLCAAISRSPDLTFGVDSSDKFREKAVDSGRSVMLLSSVEPKSLKEVIEQQQRNSPEAVMSFETALEIALTVTASFLHLYSSDWVNKSWSTNDIILLRQQRATHVDPMYIRLSSISSATTSTTNPRNAPNAATTSACEDGAKLLALASILLELGMNKSFETLRDPRDGPGKYFTIARYLAPSADLVLCCPCFRESIEFCHKNYRKDLRLMEDIRAQEIADALVYPFLRDLERSREDAIN